jgi:alkylglycerol monooxygenase
MTSELAILGVLLFIALEFLYVKIFKIEHVYSFHESVSNLSVGILERCLYLILAPFLVNVFNYIETHWAFAQIPSNGLTFILLLLVTDFVWYWYHRFGHEVNLFWAAHIVHHSSESFNFTVAARITIFQALIRSVFWCVLPLIGFSTFMVVTMLVVHGAYSFFTHTRQIPKLGWLEKILITPSHHRVHHASNPEYLDKNYGDVFVFWDKLFGTFKVETTEPQYGLTHPLKSHSFLWIHFHYYLELITCVSRQPGIIPRLKILFGPPTLISPSIRRLLERKWLKKRRSPFVPTLRNYVYFQLGVAFLGLFILIQKNEFLSIEALWVLMGIIFVTLILAGAILEQKNWMFYIEVARINLILILIGLQINQLIFCLLIALILNLVFGLLNVERKYRYALLKSI